MIAWRGHLCEHCGRPILSRFVLRYEPARVERVEAGSVFRYEVTINSQLVLEPIEHECEQDCEKQ